MVAGATPLVDHPLYAGEGENIPSGKKKIILGSTNGFEEKFPIEIRAAFEEAGDGIMLGGGKADQKTLPFFFGKLLQLSLLLLERTQFGFKVSGVGIVFAEFFHELLGESVLLLLQYLLFFLSGTENFHQTILLIGIETKLFSGCLDTLLERFCLCQGMACFEVSGEEEQVKSQRKQQGNAKEFCFHDVPPIHSASSSTGVRSKRVESGAISSLSRT
jgi:hypothetical protein